MVDVWVVVVVWGWWVFGGCWWEIGLAGGCWRLVGMFIGRGVGTLSSVGVCWPGGRLDVGDFWVCCWVGLAEWLWMLPGRPFERMGNRVGMTSSPWGVLGKANKTQHGLANNASKVHW